MRGVKFLMYYWARGVSKQRNGVMRNEKQRNGIKIFFTGGDNTSFIVNRIFC